jgi:hypothetical protein
MEEVMSPRPSRRARTPRATPRRRRLGLVPLAQTLALTLVASAGLTALVATGASAAELPEQEPGVTLRTFDVGTLSKICTVKEGQTPNVDKLMPTIDWSSDADFGQANNFQSQVSANLTVPAAGVYGFRLTSDDGSRLTIDDKVVVDHDGLHGDESPKSDVVTLAAGTHSLRIDYFDAGFGKRLNLAWQPPGASGFVTVPSSVLSTDKGVVRVTAPGSKECTGGSDTPGDGLPLNGVHPNYALTNLRPEGFEPQVTGLDFFADDSLAILTWGGEGDQGDVYVMDDVTGSTTPTASDYRKVASGLTEPMGIKIVDGTIFVSEKDQLTELVDAKDAQGNPGTDGVYETFKKIADWPYGGNFHEFAFGLLYQDGFFYLNLSVAIDLGGATTVPQPAPGRGVTLKINRETGTTETIAGGLRTPNGIGWGPDGDMFVTDNQGGWLPANKLIHVKPGSFYNHYTTPKGPFDDQPVTPPALWLPQNDIANSPSAPLMLDDGPFKGQMIFGDVTYGGIQRGFLEKVEGEYQGAVFRMTQGLESGITRIVKGPDGAIYAGGLGAGGNWGQAGKLTYGLQKLTPTSANTMDMTSMELNGQGFDITYTKPVSDETIENLVDKYQFEQWRYRATSQYGGPKIDQKDLDVTSATVSEDRKTVTLKIDGLKPGHVVHMRSPRPFAAADGETLWSTEAWYTLNALPGYVPPPAPADGIYELEDGTLAGSTSISTEHAGFSGSGFVEYQREGSSAAVDVEVDEAGTYTADLRYANGPNPFDGAKTLTMTVNGKDQVITLPKTGTWKTWRTMPLPLELQAGRNTIAFTFATGNDGNVNLDRLQIRPQEDRVEAEDATRTGGINIGTEHAGHSGTGYVEYQNVGNTTTFDIESATAGSVLATLGYANGPNPFDGGKTLSMSVNGATPKKISLPSTGSWKTWGTHDVPVTLTAGKNTIALTYAAGDDGNVNVDYLSVGTNVETCQAAAPSAGYTSLFDGTYASLDGWRMAGPGSFERTTDCTLLTRGGLGLLWHEQELKDYSLKLDWKMEGDDNAGVFIGFPDPGHDPWNAVNQGYEIQIDATDAPEKTTGAVYTFQSADLAARDAVLKPPGQWNAYEIVVVGKTVKIVLNGTVINEYTSTDPARMPSVSHIGLQNHGEGDDVQFRNVQVKQLDTAAPALTVSTSPGEPDGDNGWFTSAVTLQASATDSVDPAPVVEIDSGSGWAAYSAPLTFAEEKQTTVKVRARDAAGNISDVQTMVIGIDATPPVTGAKLDEDARTVVLKAADAASGVARTEYVLDDADGTYAPYEKAITIGQGAHTVFFRSVDRAGNVEEQGRAIVPRAGVDLTPTAVAGALSSSSIRFGTSTDLAVRVVGDGRSPSGPVVVSSGGRQVGQATLDASGRATVRISSRDLAIGANQLTVSYAGDARFAASTDQLTLQVEKATSSIRVSATKRISTSTRLAVTSRVSSSAGRPTGKVTVTVVRNGRTVLTRAGWIDAKGQVRVKLPKLKKGTYRVTAKYAGSTTTAASSRTTTVKVVRR